ncbi:MAG: BatA domain-containing protein [Candidatus Omnitrophica bacterium]|nr:BatA domain-containing protein [Candidatus Omnitrophota bacterium]
MTLLSPLGLLGFASVPALVWLWRLTGARHRTVIPSLVPFEHLLRRSPKRRSRLLVNLLFWLQLAALAGIALAMAEPALTTKPATTVLALIDTSASMGARLSGPAPIDQAKRWLRERIGRTTGQRWLIVTSAPVASLTKEPSSDAGALRQLIDAVRPSDLGGNLTMAVQIGRALLRQRPDETIILTDETPPAWLSAEVAAKSKLQVRAFGQAVPNVGIVGVSVREPLCPMTPLPPAGVDAGPMPRGGESAQPAESIGSAPAPAREASQVMVTVQNFARAEQTIEAQARRNGRLLARVSQPFEPGERSPIRLSITEGPGPVEIAVSAPRDALAVDDRLRLELGGPRRVQAMVVSENPAFLRTVGRWLDACKGIDWQAVPLPGAGEAAALGNPVANAQARPRIVITDRPEVATRALAPASANGSGPIDSMIVFARAALASRPLPSHWVAEAPHPINEYLQSIEAAVAPVAPEQADQQPGDPVLWAVLQGRRVALARVWAVGGRRTVSLLLDPAASRSSVPEVVLFFNSLRWLAGADRFAVTGEPLMANVGPGRVEVRPPVGPVEVREHPGGMFSYESTDYAGRYVIASAGNTEEREVNFLDPAESDTLERSSTLTAPIEVAAGAAARLPVRGRQVRRSMAEPLLAVVLLLMLLEWALYLRRNRFTTYPKTVLGSGFGVEGSGPKNFGF